MRRTNGLWGGAAAMLGVTLMAGSAAADLNFDFENLQKTLKWDITDPQGNASEGANSGAFRWGLHAFAHDKPVLPWNAEHDWAPHPKPQNTALLHGGLYRPEMYRNVDIGLGDGRTSVFGLYYSQKEDFDQGLPLAAAQGPVSALRGRSDVDGVDVSFSTTGKWQEGPPDARKWYTQGDITTSGTSTLQTDGAGLRITEGLAGGELFFTAKKEIKQNGKVTGLGPLRKQSTGKLKTVARRLSGTCYEQRTSAWRGDPIHLSVLDFATGELLAEQDLYEDLWQAAGDGYVDWNEQYGLTLGAYAAEGCLAGVSITMLSEWVLNPFNGTAQIVDGVFTATGDFASLPWQFGTDADGYMTAWLPVSDLHPEFSFDIEPSGLPDSPGQEVLLALSAPEIAYGLAIYDIPEPGTLLLLVAGGWCVTWWRRRA